MRASRIPGTQPAGGRPGPRASREFSFEAPPSIINLVGQLLGQGQQREVLAVAARAYLDGKGYGGEVPFEVRIVSVQIASPTPTPAPPPTPSPAESNGQG